MSKTLLDEKPLLVLPSLAKEAGLNESILIQQLHYWLLWLSDAIVTKQVGKDKRWIEDKIWIRNTTEEWLNQFPFWSESTLKRTITSAKRFGVVSTTDPNKRWDRTNLYSLDYDMLRKREIYAIGQIDPIEQVRLTQSNRSYCTDRSGHIDLNINQRLHTENTQAENTNNKPARGGKPQSGSKSLTFAESFGVDYPVILTNHLEEHRAVAIAKKRKLDTEAVRRALAEFSAMSINGFKKEPIEAWNWLCRNTDKINLSALGEKNMPQWAEV